MKQHFLAGVAAIAILGFSAPTSAQNIFQALSETYNTNPTLQAERAYLRSVDENVAIAKSGYRPTIALTGAYRDSSNNIEQDDVSTDNDVATTSMAAKFSQPLFNGFSTVNSVKSADQAVRAEQNNLYNVEQNVFLEASVAYLDVVRDTAIVELQKNNEKLLKKRLDETQQRFNVGEVTRTDVSQAKARYSQAKSDRISSEGNLEASKAIYAQIIGSAPETLEEPVDIKTFLPTSYDEAMNIALRNNYSIRQAKHLFNAKGYEVYANTGALLPQLSFDAAAT
ncbi:MAG: TolC family protein, partial [Alphaproteobacteria bacterium]|nr:TolC family protein [Alphaproteobacteria bacterium]